MVLCARITLFFGRTRRTTYDINLADTCQFHNALESSKQDNILRKLPPANHSMGCILENLSDGVIRIQDIEYIQRRFNGFLSHIRLVSILFDQLLQIQNRFC